MAQAPTIDEIELDREICRESHGGPGGLTIVNISGNAKEQRQSEWPLSRRTWRIMWVAYSTESKFRNLMAFFEARKFRAYGFRFFDWSDYDDWGNGVIKLDSEIGKYRLYKEYPDTIRPTFRPIYKPIEGTIEVDVAGATIADLDYTTGIIENASAEGTWTGQFCIPARFDSDEITMKITPDEVVQWDGVAVVELL